MQPISLECDLSLLCQGHRFASDYASDIYNGLGAVQSRSFDDRIRNEIQICLRCGMVNRRSLSRTFARADVGPLRSTDSRVFSEKR